MEPASAENTLLSNYPPEEELERAKAGDVPLSCYAAVLLLYPAANRVKLFEVASQLAYYFDKFTFAEFAQNYNYQLEMLCKMLQRRLIVIKKSAKGNVLLVFDSHLIFPAKWPLHSWVFDSSGRLQQRVPKTTDTLPTLSSINFDCCRANPPADVLLWDLITAEISKRDGSAIPSNPSIPAARRNWTTFFAPIGPTKRLALNS
jgi:hypothetical protein